MLSFSLIDAVCVIVNLFVLYLLMRKFLFGPVNKVIDARQEEIKQNLGHAAKEKAEAERLHAEYDARLAAASQQASELILNAKARGEREYQIALDEAQAETEALIANTQTQMAREREEMLHSLRREVGSLAILAAAKVSAGSFDAGSDASFLDAFLEEGGEEHE